MNNSNNNSTRELLLATTAQINDPVYRARLKLVWRNLDISPRVAPTELQDAMMWFDLSGGQFWLPSERYYVPLVDDVFPNERYLRDFLNSDHCINAEADKLLDLFVRLKYPRIARHFDK